MCRFSRVGVGGDRRLAFCTYTLNQTIPTCAVSTNDLHTVKSSMLRTVRRVRRRSVRVVRPTHVISFVSMENEFQTLRQWIMSFTSRWAIRSFSAVRYSNDPSDRAAHRYQQHPHSLTAAEIINNSGNKRKYFWNLDQLTEKTNHLIAYSNAENHAGFSNSSKLHRRRRPLATEFFQVLEAWMEQSLAGGGIVAADHAQALLRAMMMMGPQRKGATARETNQSNRASFMANFLTSGHYDVVFQSYAVSEGGAQAAEQAEALLLGILNLCQTHLARRKRFPHVKCPPEPTIKSFNIVLNCWAKSGAPDAAERAARLLEIMEEWNLECSRSDQYMGCWANERSLVSLIEAWTHSKPNEAPEQSLALLQELMFLIDNSETASGLGHDSCKHTHKYRDVKLDVAVFNAVIYAWVRSNRGRKAALQAEEILQVLIQWSQLVKTNGENRRGYRATVTPNTRTYSMVIMAWAECESREHKGYAAQRAEKILWKMLQLYREGGNDIKPNSILVTTCIAAWSRAAVTCTHAPERAEHLWTMLRNLHADTGYSDKDFEPTTEIGNAVISAWSRCTSRLDSVQRALDALEVLKGTGMADLISYNTVLDAMSKKGMGQEAMALLMELERESLIPNSLVPSPDRVSYNSVLAALSRSNLNRDASAEEAEELLKRMDTFVTPSPASDGKQRHDRKPDLLSYTCE
jgi:pentatricopeptide repeat protein